MGKRYINILAIEAVGGGDITNYLCDAVVQEEPVVVAGELKVRPCSPEAASPYAEWVVEAEVAAALLTTGKRGSGGKNHCRR